MTDNPRPKTVQGYEGAIRHWRQFMREEMGRHPACPNENHARDWVQWLRNGEHSGRPNADGTIITKLGHLSRVWEFWADDPNYPPEYNEFNPFETALTKCNLHEKKVIQDPPPISRAEVREAVHSLTHARERGMGVFQFKLGLRAGEVVNIRIEDIHLRGDEVNRHYPELGTHPMLGDYKNVIYIPPRGDDLEIPWEGREGNKSRRPRILPLDDELRRTIRKLLLIRPANPDGWLFLSKRTHSKLDPMYVNENIKPAFEAYNDDDRYRNITSHYGRHYFSSFWRERDTNSEHVKYMRGDATSEDVDGSDALAHYVHTYHDNIRDLYLDNIYKLHV